PDLAAARGPAPAARGRGAGRRSTWRARLRRPLRAGAARSGCPHRTAGRSARVHPTAGRRVERAGAGFPFRAARRGPRRAPLPRAGEGRVHAPPQDALERRARNARGARGARALRDRPEAQGRNPLGGRIRRRGAPAAMTAAAHGVLSPAWWFLLTMPLIFWLVPVAVGRATGWADLAARYGSRDRQPGNHLGGVSC